MQTLDKKQLSRDRPSFWRKAPYNGHTLFREDPGSRDTRLRYPKTSERHHRGSSKIVHTSESNANSLPQLKMDFDLFHNFHNHESDLPVKLEQALAAARHFHLQRKHAVRHRSTDVKATLLYLKWPGDFSTNQQGTTTTTGNI
jgi:hypothetical protein